MDDGDPRAPIPRILDDIRLVVTSPAIFPHSFPLADGHERGTCGDIGCGEDEARKGASIGLKMRFRIQPGRRRIRYFSEFLPAERRSSSPATVVRKDG